MYSTYNEEKSVVTERFTRTLKNKIYKHMQLCQKMFFYALDDIVDKYNNTYHNSIRMKPIDVKSGNYAKYNVDSNAKDAKFKISDHVRILKYKKIFAKGYAPNCFEEGFVVSKTKNTVPWAYVINDLNGEDVVGTFYDKELQKTKQEEFRIEKVINRKRNKLNVKKLICLIIPQKQI